jgi:hypothetical protein
MSDPSDPPSPAPPPAGEGSPLPTATTRDARPAPRRRPLPARRAEPAVEEGAAGRTRKLETAIIVAGFALFSAHLALGRTEFDVVQRFLVAIPVIPLFWELHRYHKLDHRLELPAGIFALLLYYVTFSLSAFFDTEFTDLSGPVTFTDDARLQGTAAVALGSIMIYAGFRLGEKLGTRLQPLMIRAAPPADLPDGFVRATVWFSMACMATTQALLSFSQLPAAISVLVNITFSYSFGIGITVAKPEMFRGARSRHVSSALLFFGGVGGIFRGMLDPIVRLASTTLMARWGYWRRLSRSLIVGTLAIYVIIQPIKAEFRAQTWVTRGSAQTAGYSERMDAWVTSFEHFWSGREASEETKSSALGRLMELDPIMHAFMFLPGRVQFAEGAGWLNILYAPIPRLFWADKPTTDDFEQRYSVVFNRQTKEGARSTSILLPLVIDGYWNFGWSGVVFVTVLVGLWVGVVQKMYAVKHWAIQAMGVAQLSELVVCGSLAITYSGITQHIIGPLISSWIVYWLAKFLSVKETFKTSGQANRLAALRMRRVPQRQ